MNIPRAIKPYRPASTAHFPANPPSWEDSDLTADDLKAHRELSISLDIPAPVEAARHIAYSPAPDLVFVPGYGYRSNIPHTETLALHLTASIRRARIKARIRSVLQIAVPAAIILAGLTIAALLPPS